MISKTLSHDKADSQAAHQKAEQARAASLEAACSQHCSGDVQTKVLSRHCSINALAFRVTLHHSFLVDSAPCEQGNHLGDTESLLSELHAPICTALTWRQRPACRAAAAAAARATGPDDSALRQSVCRRGLRGFGSHVLAHVSSPPAAVEQQPQGRAPGTRHCTSCGCGAFYKHGSTAPFILHARPRHQLLGSRRLVPGMGANAWLSARRHVAHKRLRTKIERYSL